MTLLLLLGLLIPIAVGTGLALLCLRYARTQRIDRLFKLIPFIIALYLLAAFAIFSFYLTGIVLAILLLVSAVLSLGIVLVGSRRLSPKINSSQVRSLLFVGALVLPLSQCGAPALAWSAGVTCDQLHRSRAHAIIEALHSYDDTHGTYPNSLQELTPTYLPEMPDAVCLKASFLWVRLLFAEPQVQYFLEECAEGVKILVFLQTNGAGYERYNLNTNEWSGVNWLDGYCSYLE